MIGQLAAGLVAGALAATGLTGCGSSGNGDDDGSVANGDPGSAVAGGAEPTPAGDDRADNPEGSSTVPEDSSSTADVTIRSGAGQELTPPPSSDPVTPTTAVLSPHGQCWEEHLNSHPPVRADQQLYVEDNDDDRRVRISHPARRDTTHMLFIVATTEDHSGVVAGLKFTISPDDIVTVWEARDTDCRPVEWTLTGTDVVNDPDRNRLEVRSGFETSGYRVRVAVVDKINGNHDYYAEIVGSEHAS